MIKKRMKKRSMAVYRINETIYFTIFLFVIHFFVRLKNPYKVIVNCIIIIIYLIVTVVYEQRRYLNTCYYVNDINIAIEKGVIFKYRIIIDKKKVQAIACTQGIIQRFFKLYTVNFYTFGENIKLINIDKSDILTFEKLGDNIEI